MTDADQAAAAHRNMLAFMRRFADATAGAAREDVHGAMLARLGVPLAFLNDVFPVDAVDDPAAVIDHAEQWFAGHANGFVVFTREGDERDQPLRDECSAREFHFQERYPEMACDGPLAEPPLPDGCELRPVEDDAAADRYWAICDAAYQTLGFAPNTFPGFPNEVLLDERTHAFIAYRGDEPVACALGWLDDEEVNFIGWVATLAEARGTGLGAAVTARATNRGFERGARLSSLQASPMGFPVYGRMGYREIANYQLYARVF